MSTFLKLEKKALVALSLGAAFAMPAISATISLGGQAATDGSVLTSSFVPASNVPSSGSLFFVETFDPATANPALGTGLLGPYTDTGISVASGCAINSYNSLGITVTGGGLGVRKGSTGEAAAPGGDSANTTCFGFTPAEGSATIEGSVKVDYSGFSLPGDYKISYLGFFFGSIDSYNSIKFYNGGALITGSGWLADGVLSGSELLDAIGTLSGNRDLSNAYINIAFAPGETFTAFEFVTTARAFELDNIVVGLQQVPEPASLALAGLGLLGAGVAARKRVSRR